MAPSPAALSLQLMQLAEHIPMAVALFDLDMAYLYANQRWYEDYGLSPAILGRSYYEVLREISTAWQQIHQDCLAGAVHHDDEVPFPRLDGSLDWLRREIRPWYDAAGQVGGLIMYTEIITERKQTQDALRAQHRFLRQVIDLNTSFIFAKDEEGRFTLVNKALAEAYGSTPEEMVGKIDEDFNPNPHETMHYRNDDLQVIRTLQARFIPEEPNSHHSTDDTRWYQTIKVPLVSEDGDTVLLLGIATDITERKRAEDALRAQHEFLRQVIDLNTSFIFAKDEDGRFTLVNKALAEAYGTSPEEMVGKYDADFNPHPHETDHFKQDDLQVIRMQQPKFIAEEPVTNVRTGETRWYQTVKVPLKLKTHPGIQLLGVATDITERKLAQDALQKLVLQEQDARHEAEAASKLKDLFLANMSHELRTPMHAIIGFLREMLYSGQLDGDNTHMAERCLSNSQRLLLLLNSVLDLSRLAAGSLELLPDLVDPAELARLIRDDLQLQAQEKGLHLTLHLDPALPPSIIHDEERLIQITTNLLGNAIKFTEAGSVRLELRRQGERLLIVVTDTGIGIPAEMQAIIFEDFVQLDSSSRKRYGGAGLGLSIVRNLTDLMGGSISVESQVGAFTRFTVNLPLELPRLGQTSSEAGEGDTAHGKGRAGSRR